MKTLTIVTGAASRKPNNDTADALARTPGRGSARV
jgi:hypothetical protein